MAKQKTTVGPIATPEGRLSYHHFMAIDVKTPERPYASGKYDGIILIPKTSNVDALKAAVVKAAQLTWPELGLTTLAQIKLPFRDGDEKDAAEYKGNIYLSCKTTNRPVIVGPDRAEWLGAVKSGDYVRFGVTAGAYKNNIEKEVAEALKAAGKTVVAGRNAEGKTEYWRPAVTFYLDAVQFVREGQAFGGGQGTKAFEADPLPANSADEGMFN